MEEDRQKQAGWLRLHLEGLQRYGVVVATTTDPTKQGYKQKTNRLGVDPQALAREGKSDDHGFVTSQHSTYRHIGGYLMLGPDPPGAGGDNHPRGTRPIPEAITYADRNDQLRLMRRAIDDFATARMAVLPSARN